MRRSSAIRDVANPRCAEARPLDAAARAESQHGTDGCRSPDAWIRATELDRTAEQAQAGSPLARGWRRAGRGAVGRRDLAYARIFVAGAIPRGRFTTATGVEVVSEPRDAIANSANNARAAGDLVFCGGAAVGACDRCNRCGGRTRNRIFCRAHRIRRTQCRPTDCTCCTHRT